MCVLESHFLGVAGVISGIRRVGYQPLGFKFFLSLGMLNRVPLEVSGRAKKTIWGHSTLGRMASPWETCPDNSQRVTALGGPGSRGYWVTTKLGFRLAVALGLCPP